MNAFWEVDEQTQQPVRLTLEADGNLDELRVDLLATEPAGRITGTLFRLMEDPGWDLRVRARYLQWPLAGASPQVYVREAGIETSGRISDYMLAGDGRVAAAGSDELQFSLALDGDRDGFDVTTLVLDGDALQANSTGAMQWTGGFGIAVDADIARLDPAAFTSAWPEGAPVEGALDVAWSAGKVELREVRARLQGTGAAVDASGTVDVDRGVVDLDLDWRELEWPVQDAGDAERVYTSEFGRLRVRGEPDDWTFEGRADFSAGDLPRGVFRLAGSGSRDQVQATLAESAVLGGTVQGEVAYNWRGGGSWSADLQTDNLHLEPLVPEWPGRISSNFTTEGRLQPLEVKVDIASLSGILRDQPLSAEGGLRYQHRDLRADGFLVTSGESFLRVDGRLRSRSGLDFATNVDEIARYYADLAGEFRGSGNIALTDDVPRLRVDLQAEELIWRDYGLKLLSVTSQGLPADEPVALTANGEGLSVGTREFDHVTLQLTASEDRQRLALEVSPGNETIAIELDGAFADWRQPLASGWSGRLLDLRLETAADVHFNLQEPADLRLGPGVYSVSGACLAGNASERLCLEGSWSGGSQFDVAAEIESMPVNLVQLFADTGVEFTQTLDGSLRVTNPVDGPPVAEGLIEIQPGTVHNRLDPDLATRTGRGTLHFDLSDGRTLGGELVLPFANRSEIEAGLRVGDVNRGAESPLDGQIRVILQDIALAAHVVPMLDEADGRLELDVALGGTLGSPDWTGEASLQDGALTYAPLGLALSEIELEGRIDEERQLDLLGRFRAGEGRGEIRSNSAAAGGAASGIDVSLQGENLTVVDLPDVNITADMDLRAVLQERRLTVNGGVLIPRARITPVNLTSDQVNESDDVVLVGGEQVEDEVEEDDGAPFNFVGTVGLQLGQDVVVDLDLAEAKLSGTTAFTWNGPPMPVAHGQYNIAGRFEAYGQLLEITEGTIRYAGVPAAEPELRIRAERDIFGNPQIRNAGVLITGTASEPEVTVYTNPATSEDRALTLLVTGSDFNYEQGVGAVDVGTYIAPDLYISYGIGLFERDNVISVRYDFARGFGIKATSGKRAEGVDLSYTIER